MSEPDHNPRGIPRAPFVEDVPKFVQDEGSADQTLAKMQEMYSKYKFMEQRLGANKRTLQQKLPDITKTLQMVKFLNEKKDSDEPVKTHFELASNVYANAVLTKPKTVCLWLGANVMLEYEIEEAIELLTKNKSTAEINLKNIDEDLDYLRDQITTCEVNTARVFNYDVRQKRAKGEM